MSEISKKWLIENKYFDKEGIEENLIYSGLTANEFIEILDSYHNSMSDVSDEEIEKWFQNYLREGITGANQRIAINEFVKWLRSRLPNKVDVEGLRKENAKLKFMIDNGLGWEDMKNDITYPHEI